jgi:hypothetical protein
MAPTSAGSASPELRISRCTQLTSVEPPSQLYRLVIEDCDALSDLESLRAHPTLEDLVLRSCHGLRDLSALATCPRLKNLTANDVAAEVLDAVEKEGVNIMREVQAAAVADES